MPDRPITIEGCTYFTTGKPNPKATLEQIKAAESDNTYYCLAVNAYIQLKLIDGKPHCQNMYCGYQDILLF